MTDFESAREAARHDDGKFGAQPLSSGGDIDLSASAANPMYSDWSPAAIDDDLAVLYSERHRLQDRNDRIFKDFDYGLKNAHHRGQIGVSGALFSRNAAINHLRDLIADPEAKRTYEESSLIRQLQSMDDLHEQVSELTEAMQPYEDEFDRRGGWTRAFLVTNQGGHVHKDMDCSTCRATTRYHWVTDMSGHAEDEIVGAAGERACTVCYPSAPVEVLSRPTTLFTPDEVTQQKAREERATAKIERDAKRIANGLTEDGSELTVQWKEESGGHDRILDANGRPTGQSVWSRKMRPKTERFKTERAASQWLVQQLAWNGDDMARGRGSDGPGSRGPYEQIVEAIARKHGKDENDVWVEILDKAEAKRRRDGVR